MALKEYKNFADIKKDNLPQVFLYGSKDGYEFDLIADIYREALKASGMQYEVIVYVSEPGDLENFMSELFNLSMFSSAKLFIIKSAQDFLKPLFSAGKKDYLENFRRNISGISENYYILFHLEGEIGKNISGLFGEKAGMLRSKNFYPGETRKALKSLLGLEGLKMDDDAQDEFIYLTPPNNGAYIKNLRKMKLYLNRKSFHREDVEQVLANKTEMNAREMADLFFKNREYEFFKEFSKFRPEADSLLLFLSIFLNKTDELRKYKALVRMNETDENFQAEFLGMKSFSQNYIRFNLGRLKNEARVFSDKMINQIYDFLLDMNIKIKTGRNQEEILLVFSDKMSRLFGHLRSR